MTVARAWLAGILISTAGPAGSAPAATEIAAAQTGVFHHLDAAGRNSLAVSGDAVALAWEDNRSGAPGCYLAVKTGADASFQQFPFGRGECFEPAVAAFDAGRFLLIWEDAGGVNAALSDAGGIGPATRLADAGGQGSIAWHPRLGVHVAWSAPDGRWRRVWRARLQIDGKRLRASAAQPADAAAAGDDQSFPALTAGPHGLMLVWEDRRLGHSVIFSSATPDAQTWTPPARVSANPTGKAAGDLGRGSGAMRPALAAFGERFAAVWLDKRDFLSGYDVYAALTGENADALRFAKDRKAQDSFGDAIAQWHAAAAGNGRGDLLIAWDDERDGTADIWLSRLSAAGYGENFTLPAASGPGRQSDPAIALDAAGNLHLAWIERGDDGATRLRYLRWPLPPLETEHLARP